MHIKCRIGEWNRNEMDFLFLSFLFWIWLRLVRMTTENKHCKWQLENTNDAVSFYRSITISTIIIIVFAALVTSLESNQHKIFFSIVQIYGSLTILMITWRERKVVPFMLIISFFLLDGIGKSTRKQLIFIFTRFQIWNKFLLNLCHLELEFMHLNSIEMNTWWHSNGYLNILWIKVPQIFSNVLHMFAIWKQKTHKHKWNG